MKLPIDLSTMPATMPEKDRENPSVVLLLDIIRLQTEQIEQLKDEINKLKNHPRKPNIKPSRLEKKAQQRPKKKKKTAKLKIHKDEPIEPEHIPDGSRFLGYNDFVVQGLKLEAHNIRYRRKIYETPNGEYVAGQLPPYLVSIQKW